MAIRFVFAAVFLFAASISQAASIGTQSMTLDGILYTAPNSETPLVDGSVVVDIKILNPGLNCILYEERQTISTALTNGRFTIPVGSAQGDSRRYGADVNNSMATVFQNAKLIPASCSGGYTPTAGDNRLLRVTIAPSTTGTIETLSPDMTINAVPTAMVAESLQGLDRDHVLAVDSSTALSQNNVANIFSATNYPALVALLSGTSAQYLKSSTTAGASIPVYSTGMAPTGATAGSLWYDSGSGTMKYFNGTSVQSLSGSSSGIASLTVSSNLTANGVAGGTLTNGSSLDLNNTGVSPNTYPKVTVDAKGRVTAGGTLSVSDIPNLTLPGQVLGDAIIGGTIGGNTAFYSSGNVTTTGTVTGANVVSGTDSTRTIFLFDPAVGSTNKITLTAPTLSSGYSLRFPNTAGLPTQVMVTDGSGNLSWATPSGGSGGSASGDLSGTYPGPTVATVGSSTASAIHSAEVAANAATDANTASTIVKRDASGNFSAGTAKLNSANLSSVVYKDSGSNTVTVQAPSAVTSYVLRWPSTAGTSSQVMTTDGSGNLSWTTPSNSASGAASGDLSGSYPGPTVATVGGSTAANVHAADLAVTAASSASATSNLMKRDNLGNFGANLASLNSVAYNDGFTNSVTLQAPAFVSSSYTLRLPSAAGTASQVMATDGSGNLSWVSPSAGSVSSVGLSLPSIFTVTTPTVTSSGTLTATLASQTANTIFAGPSSGANSAPTFRALAASDLPLSGVTAGTYRSVTVDSRGRVSAGSNPTLLGDYGITDAVQNLGGSPGIQSGTDTGKPTTGVAAGTIYFATDTKTIYQYISGSWASIVSSSGSGGTITGMTGDVTGGGSGVVSTTVSTVGTSTAAAVHTAELAANAATDANTFSTIVKRDNSGSFAATSAKLTSVVYKDSGSNTVTLQAPSAVTSYVLRWPAAAGTASQVMMTDGSGNLSWTTPSTAPSGAAGGDLTGSNYPAPLVATVGGSTASAIHSAELAANAATDVNTNSAIVKRDSSGSFSATTAKLTSANVSSVVYKDSGSNTVTLQAPSAVTSYVLRWPAAAGTASQVMMTDGSGNLSWTTPSTAPSGAAGGDLTGSNYPAPLVATVGGSTASAIHSAELAANAATDANTNSAIMKRDGSGNFSATTAKLTSANVSSVVYKDSGSNTVTIQAPSAVTSYVLRWPAAAGTASQVMTTDGSGNLSWTTPSASASGAASGDLTGSYPSPVVAKLQGKAISATAPTASQFLVYDGSTQYVPVTMSGDITMNGSGVTTLQTVPTTKGGTGLTAIGAANQVLGANAAGTGLEYKTIVGGSGISVAQSAGTMTIALAGSGGTVSSVGLSAPSIFTVTNSPVTTSGTLTMNLASQTAHQAFLGPATGSAAPTFRNLNISDLLSSIGGGSFLTGTTCTSGQALTYSAITDTMSCQTLTMTSAQVTTALGYTPVNKAGDTMTGNLAVPANGLTVGTNQLTTVSGNVGVGVAAPTAKLQVSGQIVSQVNNAASSTSIDWNAANVQYTAANCQAMTFSNMLEGGTYTLIVTGTTAGTCTFSQSSPDALTNFKFMPTNAPTTGGKSSIYTFLRAGGIVYVNWSTGY